MVERVSPREGQGRGDPPGKDPPRWLPLALFAAMLLAVAGLVGLGALLYDPPEAISVAERNYVIPAPSVASINRDPQLFIHIRPPRTDFEIVHDARGSGQRDHSASIVLCKRAGSAEGQCGIWINHGGAQWSVLFPESGRGEAEKYARRAMAFLERYETEQGA